MFEAYSRHRDTMTDQEKAAIADELAVDLEEAELADFVEFQGSTVDDPLELAAEMLEEQIKPTRGKAVFGAANQIEQGRSNARRQEVIDLINQAYNLNP